MPFLLLFIAFILALASFEMYLEIRQRRKLHEKDVPQLISKLVAKDEFEKARLYSLDKNAFSMLTSAVETLDEVLFMLMGGLPWFWNVSGSLIAVCGLAESEMLQSLAFLALFSTKSALFSIPNDLYQTFVIEERHGFNKLTLQLWLADTLKMAFLFVVIGGPVAAGVIWLVKWGGELFYLYVWFFCFVVLLVMLTIYPNLIAPLFNKFTKLKDSPLKDAIEALAVRNEFPLKELFVVDGSTRSSHSNAYFYGFGKNKRIVLYDTLAPALLKLDDDANANDGDAAVGSDSSLPEGGCTIEEIVAILGHELGHWKMNHVLRGLIVAELHVFCFFFLFGFMMNSAEMFESFGFGESRPVIIALTLFSMVISPVEHLIGFLEKCLTRHHEYQADGYAVDQGLGTDLQNGLVKISTDNKSNLNPDAWYSAYHHDHPTLMERLTFTRERMAARDSAAKKGQ